MSLANCSCWFILEHPLPCFSLTWSLFLGFRSCSFLLFLLESGTTLGTDNPAVMSSHSAPELVGILNARSLSNHASGRTPVEQRFTRPSRHRSSCSELPIFSRIRYLSFGSGRAVRTTICTLSCTHSGPDGPASIQRNFAARNRAARGRCLSRLAKAELLEAQTVRGCGGSHRPS